MGPEMIIEIFKEVRLVVPFYGVFDEDAVCQMVEQTRESALMERRIKKACRFFKDENIKIEVLGQIDPESIWQKSKPYRMKNNVKIWWRSRKYGIKKFPAFAIIYEGSVWVQEGLTDEQEIKTMIGRILKKRHYDRGCEPS